jgi:hypothetical protein
MPTVPTGSWCSPPVDPSLGRAGHRAFIVERGMPGLSEPKPEKKMGIKAYASASFTMTDLRVPADNLLGGEAHYDARRKGAGLQGRHADLQRHPPGDRRQRRRHGTRVPRRGHRVSRGRPTGSTAAVRTAWSACAARPGRPGSCA